MGSYHFKDSGRGAPLARVTFRNPYFRLTDGR